jgi:hypothetical protein
MIRRCSKGFRASLISRPYRQQAGSYTICVDRQMSDHPDPVGASLLAMDVNDDAGRLNERVVWALFASRLASTVIWACQRSGPPERCNIQSLSAAKSDCHTNLGTPATANGQVIRQSIQALQACCLASPSHERAFFVYI